MKVRVLGQVKKVSLSEMAQTGRLTGQLARAGKIGATGLALLIVAGVAASFFMPTDRIRRAVAVYISSISGQTVSVGGNAKFSLLPTPAIEVYHVEVGGTAGRANVLEAEKITAKISLIGLIFGRIEVTGLTLTEPNFSFLVDSAGEANWRSGASLLSLFVPNDDLDKGPHLGDVTIEKGRLVYRDDRARRRSDISDINVAISWPLIGSNLSSNGTFRLHGETISFRGALARPAALFHRDISPFELSFDNQAITAKLTGNALAGGDVHLEGKLSFQSPSMKLLAKWMVPEVQNVPEFGPLNGTAQIAILDRQMTLDGASIKTANSTGEGTLSFTFGEKRTSLQGTMDFDSLEGRPLLDMQIPTSDAARGTSIDSDRLGPLDVDMRLSVAKLSFGGSIVQRAAVSLFARQGQVEAGIGDGVIFGGRINGRLSVSKSGEARAGARAILNLSNIQMDDALRAFFGTARATGVGSLALDLSGEGREIEDILHSLRGDGKLRLVSGVVQGFDLTSLARRPERGLSESFAEGKGGRTSIELASASFRIADGVATTDDALIRGTAYRVGLRGFIDPRQRLLNFEGAVSPQIGSEAVRALELPFTLRGPWLEPALAFGSDGFVRKPPSQLPPSTPQE